jgi:hypothetical protein
MLGMKPSAGPHTTSIHNVQLFFFFCGVLCHMSLSHIHLLPKALIHPFTYRRRNSPAYKLNSDINLKDFIHTTSIHFLASKYMSQTNKNETQKLYICLQIKLLNYAFIILYRHKRQLT